MRLYIPPLPPLNVTCYRADFTKYDKNDTKLSLISTIYTELTARFVGYLQRTVKEKNRKILIIKTWRRGKDNNTKLN